MEHRSKKAISAVLTVCIALSLSACSMQDIGLSETVIGDALAENSHNAAVAEALSSYANFIRENPYSSVGRDPKEELMVDIKLIKEYSERYAIMAAAGAEKENSPFIAYGQEVIKLEKYADCDEFILFANGLDDIEAKIASLIEDGRQQAMNGKYMSAAEKMLDVSGEYSKMLRMAESVASTEQDMRELTAAIRELKASAENEIDTINKGSIIEILRADDKYDECLTNYNMILSRADRYVDEISAIESNIISLYAALKI